MSASHDGMDSKSDRTSSADDRFKLAEGGDSSAPPGQGAVIVAHPGVVAAGRPAVMVAADMQRRWAPLGRVIRVW